MKKLTEQGDAAMIDVPRTLTRVGNSADVAEGQMRVFEVAGTRVSLARTKGHLFAFDDTCTHAGCSLAKGKLDGMTVTCGCHGSQFDITNGAVLRGPARRPVRSRRVEVDGDDLLMEE
jgi:nitrite reductase/ring-hydroxylating ferredoxin subunit